MAAETETELNKRVYMLNNSNADPPVARVHLPGNPSQEPSLPAGASFALDSPKLSKNQRKKLNKRTKRSHLHIKNVVRVLIIKPRDPLYVGMNKTAKKNFKNRARRAGQRQIVLNYELTCLDTPLL